MNNFRNNYIAQLIKLRHSYADRMGKSFVWGIVLVIFLAGGLMGCATAVSPFPTITEAAPEEEFENLCTPVNLVQIRDRGVLVVGTSITEPFEYHDQVTGDLIGFDVDIAGYIADELDVELEWVEMPFANLIPALQKHQVDMTIAAMYINADREALVDFAEAYTTTGLVMAARPGVLGNVKSVEDLDGLRVGVKIGATGADLAQSLLEQGIDLEIIEFKNTFDSLLDLEVGRVDVVFNDYLNTLVYIKNSQSTIGIVVNEEGQVNFLSQVGLGIAVHQGSHELLDAINKALTEMKQDGTYDQTVENWLQPSMDH